MNIMRMDLSPPLLKYLSQFQFGVFPANGVVVLLAVELQDAADVVFGLLGEDDCLVGVEFVKALVDELVEEGVRLDAELFENALFVDYAHDYLVLFPVHQHFAVCQKERLFSHFIVDKLLQVKEDSEHIPTVVKGDYILVNHDRGFLHFPTEVPFQ
jgi:hypothetical protein